MLLRFFRINDPYRLLAVLLAIILLSLPLLINLMPVTLQELKMILLGEILNQDKSLYAQVWDDTPPLTAFANKVFYWLWGRSVLAPRMLTTLFIFFQAAFFAIVLINNKAYNESTYLPAFIFAILCFYSFDLLTLSPELLGSTFLLFALNNIFKEIEFRIQREETILNIGLFIGVASLFIFSYTWFLPGALVVLIVFTRLSVRKAFVLLFGYGFPHAVLMTICYFTGDFSELVRFFYLPNFSLSSISLISIKGFFMLAWVPVLYFVFSLIMLNREARFTKYQSQILQVMLLWLIIAFIEIIFTRERTPHSLLTFVPPLAYLISHYHLLIRRKRIAETMLWLFLIGIITMSYWSRAGKLNSFKVQAFLPAASTPSITGKKIMVLSDELSIYQSNTIASSFLNWSLVQPIFQDASEYENVIMVNELFRNNKPDVIIDPQNYLGKFLQRIPALQRQYKREGENYVRISN